MRLKILDYDGTTEVEEWLLRVTHYLNYYNVVEGDRVRVCSVQMKGRATYLVDPDKRGTHQVGRLLP